MLTNFNIVKSNFVVYFSVASLLLLVLPSQLLAKPSATTVQSVPSDIKNQICRDLSPDKKACNADDKISYIRSFKLDNDQVLLFFFLKDKESRYHRSLTLPVKINAEGQWITGTSFIGEPRKVLRGVTKAKRGLWMHAQFNASGKTPRLLYSKEGLDWVEVNLPVEGKRSYQLEGINNFCIKGSELSLSLQSMGAGDKSISTLWKVDLVKLMELSAISSTKPSTEPSTKLTQAIWKKVDSNKLKPLTCLPNKANNNKWVVQGGETMTLLEHHAKNLIIKVPHSIGVNTVSEKVAIDIKASPVLKDKNNDKSSNKNSNKNYVVQVGAYSNPEFAKNLIMILKKAGFSSYAKVLDNKGKKTNRIYIGPYKNRAASAKKLAELKVKFHENTAMQSAFIVHLR